jgi:hypothetical protein
LAGYHKWDCREPSEWVRAWIAMGGDARAIPEGFHLSDTYSLSGCGLEGCGSQSWTWDLTPRYDK